MEESDAKVDVLSATCNRRQEPVITRQQEKCSPVGANGRTDGEECLVGVCLTYNNLVLRFGISYKGGYWMGC